MNNSSRVPQSDAASEKPVSDIEQLQDFVDNAAIGLHCIDERGIIKWANKAELDMLGYLSHEYIGHEIAEFHVDQEKITDILSRLARNETLKGYIAQLRHKDGSNRTVSISSNVYRRDGNFIHTRCFTVDITEQVVLSKAFRQSESRYYQLLEMLPAAVYTTDAAGRITFYNKVAVELWGREPKTGFDSWCGSWKMFRLDESPLPPDSCPMASTLKELRPVWGEEIIIMRPDGSTRHVASFPQPLLDSEGNLTGGFNMLMDVTDIRASEKRLKKTERKLRELNSSLEQKIQERTRELTNKHEELKKSEERYYKMVAEVEDYAILLLDEKGFIQNWNAGAQKIKGYRADEIVGKHFSVFYLPDDRASGLPHQLFMEALTTGKALHEGWRLRKDGTTFWGSIVITAIHDDENRVIGFSKVTRDLSDRKRKEDQIRQYTAQLELQNKELEQFAYGATHDMKEPLRKIQFFAETVSENTRGILDEKNRHYLERAMNAANRMQQLIDDILAYSRTMSATEQMEMVDLGALVDEFINLRKEEIDHHAILIRYGNLPVLPGIPFQFKQLLDNLLGNAVKYRHPERQSVIDISHEEVDGSDLDVENADTQRRYHIISVTDNGIGFDQKYADKIFDMFQRLHVKNDFSGSGLGLSICKKIAQNHQGFITAWGRNGEGAKFSVYLPGG